MKINPYIIVPKKHASIVHHCAAESELLQQLNPFLQIRRKVKVSRLNGI